MEEQNRLYVEMQNALHRWLNNKGNDEADWQQFRDKSDKYREYIKNES